MKKFLADESVDFRIVKSLRNDALHTRDLPNKNLTDDMEIIRIADNQERIVTSKNRLGHNLKIAT